jgi:uncharacterized protein
MSEANVEIVRRSFEAFNRGDLDAAFAEASDDVVTYRDVPDASEFHGTDGFLAASAEWAEGFDDWTITPQEYIDAGADRVMARVLQSARGKNSGVPISEDWWFVYTVRGGKLARLEIYAEREKAYEAAGLAG